MAGAAAGVTLAAALGWAALPRPELYPAGLGWSRVVRDRHGEIVHLSPASDGRYRLQTPLDSISPALINATLAKEDRYFRWHPGVNPASLARAAWSAVTGRPAGGASTLTMQVARLRWDLATRSPGGKLVQIFRALQLERHYTKDQILDAYFNLTPYGGNVEGAGAAALLWCGHPCAELSEREAIALAVIPQSPASRHPARPADRARLAIAQARLSAGLAARGVVRPDPLAADFTLVPPQEPPHRAPHYCRRLMTADPAAAIAGTLDLRLQGLLEDGIRDGLSRTAERGIENACAVLIHAPSREVLAYVGSAEYENRRISGMVDGLRARRSPGSALKPFAYGLALQQGLIHPQSMLVDGPMTFGDYNPENFEGEFMGPVNAHEALLRSRNIPAVDLTRRLEAPGLYGLLRRGGVRLDHPPGYYGLTLVLGGAGVTPLELGRLYAALADDGHARPLRFQPETPVADGPLLLEAPARFLVLEMLAGGGDLGRDYAFARSDPSVAWKTGTSHGFRDAWAVGIRGDYVLVLWMGNFDGRGNNALVARYCAAPLLFELFARLDLPDHLRVPPAGVRQIEVCSVSGDLPGPHCPHRKSTWFIPGVSPIRLCDLHREILIDGDSGLRVAADDGRPGLRHEVREFWPPDLLALFRRAGLPRAEPPAPENGTANAWGLDPGTPPAILSPLPGRTYFAGSEAVVLRARAAPGVKNLYWFGDDGFLGSSGPTGGLDWQPAAGSRTLRVLDDHGRAASLKIAIRNP